MAKIKKEQNTYKNRKKSTKKRHSSLSKKSQKGKYFLKNITLTSMLPFLWVFRKLWSLIWRLSILSILLFCGFLAFIYFSLPDYEKLVDGRSRGSVTFLDRSGNIFAWRGDQLGDIITSDSIVPLLKHAVISTEDKRFYKHFGVSPRGIVRAIKTNLQAGRGPLQGHGGSTITQQTAKLLCLGKEFNSKKWKNERLYEADCRKSTKIRKIKEAIFAIILEFRYSKNEILSIYLNRAYLGAGTRGFEAASKRYFNISSDKLNISQAAMLAGLLKAPSAYAPTNNLQKAQSRANLIVHLMHAQKYITSIEKEEALKNPATVSNGVKTKNNGYFVDWVMNTIPSFLTRKTMEDVVIKTTYDSSIQKEAEDAIDSILSKKLRKDSLAEIAVVVMSSNGAVRGMIGGRKKNRIGTFNRATQAKRQTGSAFKPFVYATALESGFKYNSIIEDAPLSITLPNSEIWSPKNNSRGYIGNTTLTDSFRLSINTVAVKLSEAVGRENVIKTAERLGLHNKLKNTPSVALGTSEHTLLELTGAYAGILNKGKNIRPYGITELKLKDSDQPLMTKNFEIGNKILSKTTTQQLIYMMHRTIHDGTGARAKIAGIETAGKTGTTQGQRDAWFVGFTSNYIVGVWMGNDKNQSLKGVHGGGLPAEIWKEIIIQISKNLPSKPLPMIRPNVPPTLKNGIYTKFSKRSEFNIFKKLKSILSHQKSTN
jgi:membrane peptidoglycan carboxypeptidase